MDSFSEIGKVQGSIGLVIAVIVTVILLISATYLFFKQETVKITEAQKTDGRKITLPIKVQAYERLVLFLERINPE